MANLGDGFKDIFLAGVGAMAITGEKVQDLIGQLIEKGEITVDQGKELNNELRHKAEEATANLRYDALKARMDAMTPEERSEFAARAAEYAAAANAKDAAAAEPAQEAPAAEAEGAVEVQPVVEVAADPEAPKA